MGLELGFNEICGKHDVRAMLIDTWDRQPRGNEVAPTNEVRELCKATTFDPELSFEHDDS
jgi:hypothetical protein